MKKFHFFISFALFFTLLISSCGTETETPYTVEKSDMPNMLGTFDKKDTVLILDQKKEAVIPGTKNALIKFSLETGQLIHKSIDIADSNEWSYIDPLLASSGDESSIYSIEPRGSIIKQWDSENLTQTSSIKINNIKNLFIEGFDINFDGTRALISFNDSEEVQIWDITSKKLLHTIKNNHYISLEKIYFNKAGSHVVVFNNLSPSSIWDASTGKKLIEFEREFFKLPGYGSVPIDILDIKYISNQTKIARLSSKKIDIIDARSFETIKTIDLIPLELNEYIAEIISIDQNLENAFILKGVYLEDSETLLLIDSSTNPKVVNFPKRTPPAKGLSEIEKSLFSGVKKIGISPNREFTFALFDLAPSALIWETSTGKLIFKNTENTSDIIFTQDSQIMLLIHNTHVEIYSLKDLYK